MALGKALDKINSWDDFKSYAEALPMNYIWFVIYNIQISART